MITLKEKIIFLIDLFFETLDNVTDSELYHPGRFLWANFESYPRRRSVQTTLSRMLKAKEIRKNNYRGAAGYILTPLGLKALGNSRSAKKQMTKKWEGSWLMVIYDIPEEKARERDVLRKELKELGFGFWQKSTWISPFNVGPELHRFMMKKSFVGVVSVMEARQLYGIDDKKVASQAWPLERIEKEYLEVVDKWHRTVETRNTDPAALRETGRELLNKYFEIKNKDPQLPPELLPTGWPEKKINRTVREICRHLASTPASAASAASTNT
ncbi:MAG: PaaX family transcriptional regulator C-terminal domain-containing protein [Patescibacteria group bacterium]